jgi:phenylalanyl-tRNA synthetase beta chain
MPSIILNRKVFEKLVGKKLPDEKLKDRISYLGTDLESIDANEINLEIFPNRPDLLSEQGFARAFSSFIGVKTGLRKYEIKKSNEKVIIDQSVKKVRPYTACAIVKGLKFDDEKIKEIIQIQEKLHITYGRNRKKVAIGIYPYEKITPPIKFIAKKPREIKFQPLEFPREINGLQILSQHPAGRDYGHLLEGMSTFPLFVDSKNKVLSMPPIINSHDVGKISEKTTDVFIECSGFRYEVLAKCLNMIVTALSEMGGIIYSMEIDMYGKKLISPDLSPTKMKFNKDYINKRLGLNLSEKEIEKLLKRMGYGYEKGTALVPAYRSDVLHPIDLVEDIAIAYGYDNIIEEIPKVATTGKENSFEVFKRRISEIMVGIGLLECKTYHITNKVNQTKKMNFDCEVIDLSNALNQEFSVMAAWNIPLCMEIFQNNKHHEYPQSIYSFGSVFKKDNSEETGVIETDHLSCAVCSDSIDFTRIRQVLDYLLRMIETKYSIKAKEHSSFIKGRAGSIIVNNKEIGTIGEINPKVLENWDLQMPVSAFELDLNLLFELIEK